MTCRLSSSKFPLNIHSKILDFPDPFPPISVTTLLLPISIFSLLLFIFIGTHLKSIFYFLYFKN